MSQPNHVERVSKTVIENQLLVALDDKSKVACLFAKEDLDVLISALTVAERVRYEPQAKEMRLSLEQLRKAAFP